MGKVIPGHTIIPKRDLIRTEPPKPCMQGTIDIDLYNQTGEIQYIQLPREITTHDIERDRRSCLKAVMPIKPSKPALTQDRTAGLSVSQIAEKYHVSRATVNNWIRGYGLKGIRGKERENTKCVTN